MTARHQGAERRAKFLGWVLGIRLRVLLAALVAAVACLGVLSASAALPSGDLSDTPWVYPSRALGSAAAVPTGYWVDVDESGITTSGVLGGGGSLAATGTGNVNYGYAQECAPSGDGGPFSIGHYPPSTCAQLGRPYNSSGSPEQPSGFWFTGNQNCVNAGRSFSGADFTWQVQLPQTGSWHVEVYIPSWTSYGFGDQYILTSADGRSENYPLTQQAYHGQWVNLFGPHQFTANQDYTVELSLADGSDSYCHYQIADQMKWVYDGSSTTPPVNTSPPTISGQVVLGKTLTEYHGKWTGSPSSYSYQWEDCGSSGSGCSPISGATSQSYRLLPSDVGHTIVVEETATNAGGLSNPASSAATAVVTASSPPPPPPPTPCVSGPGNPPRDVVILITGLTSELRYTDRYDPLGKSYCGLANASTDSGELRDLAHMAQKTFDDNEDGTISPINLTDSLAGTGAVLLPFSYNGVSLTQAAGKPPLYQVAKFDSGTPGAVIPKDEATGYLLGLIKQIHAVWPHAHIQVIGHSEGGFVAEQLFEWEKYSTLTSLNVTRIFSLDSPINGVALASNDWLNQICATVSGASNASCHGIISPGLLELYAERWENKEANDRALIKRDAGEEHQLYIPIGTQHDWLYTIGDVSTTFGIFTTGVCEGLDSQILWNDFSFSCYLEDIQNQGNRKPSELSYVTNDPSAGTPVRPGFALKSHDFVMQSADNIKFITAVGPGAYVQSARASRSFKPPAAAYSPMALAASSTSPPGALFEQVLAPAPFAVLPKPVAWPGQAFKITGSDLGETPGHVFFSSANGEVAAIIRSWTPKGIEVVVPAEATSGIVRVLTPTEDELLPGVVAVVASGPANKVFRILEVGRLRAINGEGDRIKLRALDRRHRAVPGATVELVGGGITRRARTDRRGLATFVVVGDGEQQYIAVSGTTTTLFTAHWRRAARQTFVLTVHRKRRRTGRPAIWTIMASIRNAAGGPVAGELVNYKLHALPGSTLHPTRARTNSRGTAQVTVSVPLGATALVEALTNHATLARGVTVSN